MVAAPKRINPVGRVKTLKILMLLILPLLIFSSDALAESPKEQLQKTIDSIIEVLKTIRSPQDIERNRSSLRQLLLTRFDFAAMAQRSLGNRWDDLNGNQQEFVSVFTDFVEHAYMSTLGSYRGERVMYDADRVDGKICRSQHSGCRRRGSSDQNRLQASSHRERVDGLRRGYR